MFPWPTVLGIARRHNVAKKVHLMALHSQLLAETRYQAAKEVSRSQTGRAIQHGLLTFALLEGLSKAKRDSEGKISEREWMNYLVEQVPLKQTDEMKKRNRENKARSGRTQHRTGFRRRRQR